MSSKENVCRTVVRKRRKRINHRKTIRLFWKRFTNKRPSKECRRRWTALSDRAEAYASAAGLSSSLSKTTTSVVLLLGLAGGGFESGETRRKINEIPRSTFFCSLTEILTVDQYLSKANFEGILKHFRIVEGVLILCGHRSKKFQVHLLKMRQLRHRCWGQLLLLL